MRLYDLTEQYQTLLELLEESPDDQQLSEMLHGLEGAIEEKVENIVKIMKTLEGEAKIVSDEVNRLSQRQASIEANRERLKAYTEELLTQAGLEKLKGKFFNIWMQTNPPSVMVLDESKVPKQYFVTKSELQKKAILEDWKNGTSIPGVEIRQERSLRVR